MEKEKRQSKYEFPDIKSMKSSPEILTALLKDPPLKCPSRETKFEVFIEVMKAITKLGKGEDKKLLEVMPEETVINLLKYCYKGCEMIHLQDAKTKEAVPNPAVLLKLMNDVYDRFGPASVLRVGFERNDVIEDEKKKLETDAAYVIR